MRSKILSLKMKDQSQTLLEARLEWEHPQSGEKAEKKKNCCPPAAWGHSFIKTVCVGRNDGWDSVLRMWSTLKACRACHCVAGWYYTSESNTVLSVKLNHVKLAIVSPNCWFHMVESSTHTHQSNSSVSKCIAQRHFCTYAQDIFVVSKHN